MRRYRYYEILGVNKDASPEEIKRQYRNRAFESHPDKHPDDPEANKKFAKINEAYEVLSNPLLRLEYDNSPEECPDCWTYKVIQIVGITWRCRRCYCQFDSSGVTKRIDEIEKAAIPERQRQYMKLFQTTQCSWCKKFYTQPFLCPYKLLHSNCIAFVELSKNERYEFLKDEKWWWRMQDMIVRVEENVHGVLARCRMQNCLALNPNPRKNVCWRCGEPLTCPKHLEVLLRYDIDGDYWQCRLANHSQKYRILPIEKGLSSEEQEKLWDDINIQLVKERERKQRLEEERKQEEERKRRQQLEEERRQEEERKQRLEEERKQEEERKHRKQMAEKNKQAGIRIARRYKGLCVNCGRPLSMLDKKVTGQIKCKTCREKNKKDTKQRKHQK